MNFPNAHTVNINGSTLNDVGGDYIVNTALPGERGIDKLFKASCLVALHDSRTHSPPPQCHPGTRVSVLHRISDWIDDTNEPILWISGPAGAGKSAIARTIANDCARNDTLAASFFFFHLDSGRNTIDHLIPSIAFQLAIRIPHKRALIGSIVEADPSILHKPLDIQIKDLILPPFLSASSSDMHSQSALPFLIIIDGLDECTGDNAQRSVVKYIGGLANTTGVPLRLVIVSRPEPQIDESFRYLPSIRHISLSNKAYTLETEKDIHTYLRNGFDKIYRKRDIITEEFWPEDRSIARLVHNSGENYIYPETVLKYVDDDDFHPVKRLVEILDTPLGLTAFAKLNYLYQRVLSACKDAETLVRILAIVTLTSFDVQKVEWVLQLDRGTGAMVLRRLRSVLEIKKSNHIVFYHKSFTDFIHNKERAGQFYIDFNDGRAFLAQGLLRCFRDTPLEMNNIPSPGKLLWESVIHSGRWEQHPYLVEEISQAMSYLRFNGLESLHNDYFLKALQWLEENLDPKNMLTEVQPMSRSHDPLEVQYRLFKQYWIWAREVRGSTHFHIFTRYDDFIDITFMVGGETVHHSFLPHAAAFYWDRKRDCCVFSKGYTSMYKYERKLFRRLFKRLLQEPGDLGEYYRESYLGGHAFITIRFLDQLQYPLCYSAS